MYKEDNILSGIRERATLSPLFSERSVQLIGLVSIFCQYHHPTLGVIFENNDRETRTCVGNRENDISSPSTRVLQCIMANMVVDERQCCATLKIF